MGWGHGLDRFGSGNIADFCDCGSEHLGYIKYGKLPG